MLQINLLKLIFRLTLSLMASSVVLADPESVYLLRNIYPNKYEMIIRNWGARPLLRPPDNAPQFVVTVPATKTREFELMIPKQQRTNLDVAISQIDKNYREIARTDFWVLPTNVISPPPHFEFVQDLSGNLEVARNLIASYKKNNYGKLAYVHGKSAEQVRTSFQNTLHFLDDLYHTLKGDESESHHRKMLIQKITAVSTEILNAYAIVDGELFGFWIEEDSLEIYHLFDGRVFWELNTGTQIRIIDNLFFDNQTRGAYGLLETLPDNKGSGNLRKYLFNYWGELDPLTLGKELGDRLKNSHNPFIVSAAEEFVSHLQTERKQKSKDHLKLVSHKVASNSQESQLLEQTKHLQSLLHPSEMTVCKSVLKLVYSKSDSK